MLPTFLYFILKTLLLQLYPAYISYKAIKSSSNYQQLAPLLMYWIVTATFLVAEYVSDIVLFWFPFYNDIKALLVIWFILPQTQGSVIIYQQAIQPFLAQHESRIDRALLDLQKQARRTGLEYGKRGIAILNSALGDLLVKLRAMILSAGPESATPAPPPQTSAFSKLPSFDIASLTPFAVFSSLIRDPNSPVKDDPFFIHPASLGAPPKDQTELRSQRDHLEKMMKDLDALEPTLLERTESFDSIASYESAKKVTPSTSLSEASAAGWSGYFSGWWPTPKEQTEPSIKSKDE
ncbi:hypothetical protein K450DRAFT_282712 [Umbelopsis ramanniana AG]|uniref:Protein YOP1 n=1 Tax=Umbelopsis ramanniana AG TaxID=1314678 RepID=A0AAD5E6Q1_UMBRA|nr:uncharacterized protein K450DRAFT_282712 [Umbelopsis ramanniana AG]KAI8577325.1 hypothetical protein K450DRAFT_282712 [Umbelopsis ramanniana AG]